MHISGSFDESSKDTTVHLILQVSVVRFASSAEVVISPKINQTLNEIMVELDKVKFTGGGTRIANAVDLALSDLSRSRRDDAIQVINKR